MKLTEKLTLLNTTLRSLALLLVAIPAAVFAEEGFVVTSGVRQLFLDDQDVERIENLMRTMHQPTKRGAVIRSSKMEQTIQTRTAPVWDSDSELFKFWVLGIDDKFWQSRDGLHWTPGPKSNMRTDQVVYDPLDPDPARRFKAALLNEGFAVSADGTQWTRLDLPKIPSSDEGNLSYDPHHGLYIHTVKRGGPNGRAVAIATSRDFKTWDDHGIVFHADDLDQEMGRKNIAARRLDLSLQQPLFDDPSTYRVDVYNMGVFRYEGLYLGMPAFYHATGPVPNYPNTEGFHLVQLACSRDLKLWRRLGDRQPFIGPSRKESGAYDLMQILPPSAPVVHNNELWFYYTGLKYRVNWKYVGTYPNGEHVPLPGLDRDVGGVCLAVLRRDGFVSLDAAEKIGTVTSRPFRWTGKTLLANFVAQEQGELRAEVLNESGQVIAASHPLTGDHPQGEFRWHQGSVDALTGQNVRLRFSLRHASLYAYWLNK